MFFSPKIANKNLLEKIIIRQMEKADLPALEWEGEYIHFRPMFERAYRRAIEGMAVQWVAILPSSQMLGQVFVQLKSSRNEMLMNGRAYAYLYAVRVRPEYRNIGLGSRLMHVAEMDLIYRGYGFATLNVARDNPKGIRFYERLGYQIVGEEEGRWSYTDHLGQNHLVHEPAWRMEKRLIGFS